MQEKYWASRIPLVYALLFVLNVAIFVLFEMLLIYTLPQQLTPQVISQEKSAYENCEILSFQSSGKLKCYLVKVSNGDRELLVTKQHPFLITHYKLLENQTAPIPASGTITVTIRTEMRNVPVTVENGTAITPFVFGHTGGGRLPVHYLLVGALLEVLELMAFGFVKRNL